MAIINLRRYYPHYPRGKFLEVPDEVAEALEEGRRIEHRQDNRRSYYHVYSMDCTPAIENHAMFLVLSPEELLIQDEDEASAELVLENLATAMSRHLDTYGKVRTLPCCLTKTEDLGSLPQQGTQIFGSHSAAYLPRCVKNFIFFLCPLDGVRLTLGERPFAGHHLIS